MKTIMKSLVALCLGFCLLLLRAKADTCYGAPHQFQCDSGKCLSAVARCDGDKNCDDYSDENFCENEALSNNFLVVTQPNNNMVYWINVYTGHVRALLPVEASNPAAVTVDTENKDIYFTDTGDKTIIRVTVDDYGGRAMYLVYKSSEDSILEGIAINSQRKHLYFSSNTEKSGSIIRISTRGEDKAVVYQEKESRPRAIVFDLKYNELYWTDVGEKPSINRLELATGKNEVIISSKLRNPVGLAIDFEVGEMFWVDVGTSKIETASIDGSERRELLTDYKSHYVSMALSPSYLYLVDRNVYHVNKVDRLTLSMTIQAPISFSNLAGIAVYYSNVSTPLQLGDRVKELLDRINDEL